MVMATLTPLCARNEIYHWDNRPFISSWPEPTRNKTSHVGEIKKTIKKKPKRTRTSFTTDQLKYLEEIFKNQPYINSDERIQMAKTMKIGEKQIKVWFQNRRMKQKRRSSEMSETYSEISSASPSSIKNEFEYSVSVNGPNNTYFEVPIEMYDYKAMHANHGEANVTDYQLPIQTYNIPDTNNAAFVDFFDAQYANYNNIPTNANADINVGNFYQEAAHHNFAHYNEYYYYSSQNNGHVHDFTAWQ